MRGENMRPQRRDNGDSGTVSGKLRGVCKNKKTGRFEAHIWCKGKGYYLGSFRIRKLAAEAVDLAHLKLGRDQKCLNYGIEQYKSSVEEIQELSFLELVELLRRQSCGFSRGSAKYRGVSKRAEGKWEARIGSFMGRSYTYLGTFATGQAAARAYDVVAVLTHGVKALTNYGMHDYQQLSECISSLSPDHHMQAQEYFYKNARQVWSPGCDENAHFWEQSLSTLLKFCSKRSDSQPDPSKQQGGKLEQVIFMSRKVAAHQNSEQQKSIWRPKVKKLTSSEGSLLTTAVLTSNHNPLHSPSKELCLSAHKGAGLNKICAICGSKGQTNMCTCLCL
mmetsp:Transcript_2980/g.18751  ORF Transcript_2980/g.18751 Transcript_2980/m.18751 type:complete len:334 (-) Transcript_2980:1356-2357(-)